MRVMADGQAWYTDLKSEGGKFEGVAGLGAVFSKACVLLLTHDRHNVLS
jgi:hypothetical protein